MAKIIRQSERVRHTEYRLDFEWKDSPGSGFCFPCDKEGNILREAAGSENLAKCLSGEYDVINQGVTELSWSVTRPGILLCDCGKEVSLSGFTCPCDCGRDYNQNGQLLASRSQWGEETGEHVADILRIA